MERRPPAKMLSTAATVIIKTVDGIVTSWPESAEALFGYSAGEMIGHPITRIFPGERLSEEDELLARIRRGERIENWRTARRTKDGRIVDVSISLLPIRDQHGNAVRVLKTMHVGLAERDGMRTPEGGAARTLRNLRTAIREKITVGQLSSDRPVMVCTGGRRGRLCDACNLPIGDEARYEVDMSGGVVYGFHQTCLILWREECVQFRESPTA